MGISRPGANFLARQCRDHKLSGSCLTLGRQVISFDSCFGVELAARYGLLPVKDGVIEIKRDHPVGKLLTQERLLATYGPYKGVNISDETFFKLLGFDHLKSLDFSDYESADHLMDLNDSPDKISVGEKFDLVYDGGTLEHIFNVPNALGNIFELTKVGGCVVFETPCNNYLDHGFYQICPTLFFDYYQANEWEILDIRILQIPHGSEDPEIALKLEKMPYFTTEYTRQALQEVRMGGLIDARYNVEFIARKTEKSTLDRVPQQGMYRSAWRSIPR